LTRYLPVTKQDFESKKVQESGVHAMLFAFLCNVLSFL